MKWLSTVVAMEVAATGLILLFSPALFGHVILGAELSDSGQALGRLTGIAMIGAGLAAWPAPAAAGGPAVRAMLIYNLLATIYLCYLGMAGQLVGVLLWPAVALHAVLSLLLGRVWLVPDGR